ncbi:hypothetical protein LY78DRAFT_697864 [Colletotrichum sublineola]|uniref:Uncharacterized protein n=1 Tax=Colletotrichum sublineola TaxID=1173701 RepID=A0A066XNU0_COLSU|nr:hypothetical protein LY78DRAFT_697864 [Colletotrichum sublineola]KDN67401.1 hypothetical protein CSUB01_09068 [Colletotrichum sublineola]
MRPQCVLAVIASVVCSAAAAPTEDHPESAFLGPFNITDAAETENSLLTLNKRDECGTNGPLFSKNSINNLMWDLQNNDPDGMQYVPHNNLVSWSNGDAQVCVKNTYAFENTHVKRWEVGWAIGYIRDMCCTASGNPQCEGGEALAHGDSGLPLVVYLRSKSRSCGANTN